MSNRTVGRSAPGFHPILIAIGVFIGGLPMVPLAVHIVAGGWK